MKILYLAMESCNWVINLCNEFCNQGHEVTCIVQTIDDYNDNININVNPKLQIIKIPYNDFFDIKKTFNNYIEEFKQQNYDIVMGSHTPVCPLVYYLSEALFIPKVIMLLDIPTDLMEQDSKRMDAWKIWFEFLKKMDAIITNTYVARDEYFKYTGQYLPDECVITYATNLPKKYYKTGLDIIGDYAVSVCRLTTLKNCVLIPKALKLTSLKKYIAIGREYNEYNNIKNQCKQNNIEFIYYNNVSESDKFEIIKNSNCLIYPQSTEYIGGLSPFEGMFCGKPVFVSGLKVQKDLFGKHVNYFENNNAENLAQEINNIKKIPILIQQSKLIMAAKYAKKTANYKVMATKILKILNNTLNRGG